MNSILNNLRIVLRLYNVKTIFEEHLLAFCFLLPLYNLRAD